MTTVRTWLVRATALACAGTLLAGCGTDAVEVDHAAADDTVPADASAVAVDPAALDTGDFPTSPSAPFGRATDENIIEIDGQRLAEFVTLPFEVDPALVANANPTVVLHPGQLSYLVSADMREAVDRTGILYGYATAAETATLDAGEAPRELVHIVLRAATPEDARVLADDMYQAALDSADEYDTPGTPWVPLDSRLDGARTVQGSFEGLAGEMAIRQSFTAHGDYVIYDWASTSADDAPWAEKTPGRAVELQKPLIDRFPATPTRTQNGGVMPELPMMDQDDILIYAVPGEAGDAHGIDMAVYGPRGLAHGSTNPELTHRVLTEAGSEHNAVGRTIVYRAEDDEGAESILTALTGDLPNQGFAPSAAPAGLPEASCLMRVTALGEQHLCYVSNGRYVGEAMADSAEEAGQLISAQYLILTRADQDA